MGDLNLFDDDKLYTEKKVEEKTGYSGQTYRNWRARGEGPRYLKVGKKSIRYPGKWLNEFFSKEGKTFG